MSSPSSIFFTSTPPSSIFTEVNDNNSTPSKRFCTHNDSPSLSNFSGFSLMNYLPYPGEGSHTLTPYPGAVPSSLRGATSSSSSGSSSTNGDETRQSALDRAIAKWKYIEDHSFRRLKEISSTKFIPAKGFTDSIGQANADYNRYEDILPWDHHSFTPYLNASRIVLDDQRYIATDAPRPAYYGRFWNMVWTEDVRVMVNLTEVVESGRPKADPYWEFPGNSEISLTLLSKEFILATEEDEFNMEDFDQNRRQYIIKRTYELSKGDEKRTVSHYHYRHWPDRGAPKSQEELASYKMLLDVVKTEASAYPLLAHCSAGVGRTGTFLVNLFFERQGIVPKNPTVAAGKLILRMRAQRNHMVQSSAQFDLITRCLQARRSIDM